MVLADVVGRVRLAGEDDLHRPFFGIEDAREAIGIMKDELRPLVSREPPREADRQTVWGEQRAGGYDARDAHVLHRPTLPRALPDEGEEIPPQLLTDLPQFPIRNREDALPKGRVVVTLDPVWPE